MEIHVTFYSYFKDLAGCAQTTERVLPGSSLGDLLEAVCARYPKLAGMRKSMLVAVGVEYQNSAYRLQGGDEVSLFPPVQGG